MKKHIIKALAIKIILITYLTPFSVFSQTSQELVRNGSFEDFVYYPAQYDYWFNTPDHWFRASDGGFYLYSSRFTNPKMPENEFGFQYALPLNTGKSYLGLQGGWQGTSGCASSPSGTGCGGGGDFYFSRAGTQLITPFEKGKTYLIECYVSKAEKVGASSTGEETSSPGVFKFQISKSVQSWGIPRPRGGRMEIGNSRANNVVSDNGKPDDKRWKKVSFTYTHEKDEPYPYFFVRSTNFPENAGFYLDNVSIIKLDECGNACCPEEMLYQNTTSIQPFSSTKQIIKAGSAVDPNLPNGDATVLSGQSVEFQAGSEITLAPGFIVQSGASFNAKIAPCSTAKLSLRISNQLKPCSNVLCATVCGGSNNYTLNWSDGLGSGQRVEVAPTTTKTYTVTVTDNTTGQTASQNITVVPQYFTGPLYSPGTTDSKNMIPNVITPNGDGYNDIWTPTDYDKTEYAFGAYRFELSIANRWGTVIYTDDETVNAPGFMQGDIYWNGRVESNGALVSAGVYYYYLKLYSCSATKEFNGSISVMDPQGRLSYENLDSPHTEITADQLFEAFPNPSSSSTKVSYTIAQEGPVKLWISDSRGRNVLNLVNKDNHQVGLFEINYTNLNLPAGMYFYTLQTPRNKFTRKIIIIK